MYNKCADKKEELNCSTTLFCFMGVNEWNIDDEYSIDIINIILLPYETEI